MTGSTSNADGDGQQVLYVVDREKGTGVGISFCETEEDMRRADAAMNEMSPDDDDGRRSGPADICEVVLDESY